MSWYSWYGLMAIAAFAVHRSYAGKPFKIRRAMTAWLAIAGILLVCVLFNAGLPRALSKILDALLYVPLVFLPVIVLAGYWGAGHDLKWMGSLKSWWHQRGNNKYLVVLVLVVAAAFSNARFDSHSAKLALVSLVQVFLFGVVITAALLLLPLFKRKPDVKKERPDLLSDLAVSGAVVAACSNTNGVFAGDLRGQPLRVSVEDRAVVIGPPGTGKTAFLVTQLLDWAESGRSFVVNDIKPEIYAIVRDRLEAQGYTLFRFNPTGDGHGYNPLDDLDSAEAVGELAAALIPSPSAEDAVFNESARDLLDAMITHLRAEKGRVALTDVYAFVGRFDDYRELLKTLRRSPSEDARMLANSLSVVAQNERLLGSIVATLSSNLRFLRYPVVRQALAHSDFKLQSLLGEKVGLFLQFEERHQETTAQLFSVMMGHVMRYFIEHTQRQPVLLLLDEIGNTPRVAGLVRKLNTIRSRNLPTWLYWQSKEQMQAYGEKADECPNMILGACDLHMVFRVNDNATADWLSQKIGTVDRLVKSVSVTTGDSWFPNVTRSDSLVQEPVVFPHELQKLAAGEIVGAYRGLAWRGKAAPYFQRWPEYARGAAENRPIEPPKMDRNIPTAATI